jgi:hypothetical protein
MPFTRMATPLCIVATGEGHVRNLENKLIELHPFNLDFACRSYASHELKTK